MAECISPMRSDNITLIDSVMMLFAAFLIIILISDYSPGRHQLPSISVNSLGKVCMIPFRLDRAQSLAPGDFALNQVVKFSVLLTLSPLV